MQEFSRGAKLAIVWLLIGTAVFVAVQAFEQRSRRPSWTVPQSGVVLGHALAVAEAGTAVVAGAGIDARESMTHGAAQCRMSRRAC